MLTLISFLFVLSLLVFVHELGHYLVAKISGIGVDRFSIGLPPRLFGVKVGETDYCISAIPFGGYVKLVGQDDFVPEDENAESTGPKDFRGKPAYIRVAVLFAGSFMNLLTAVVLFSLIFWKTGAPENSTKIGYVNPGSPAEKIGLIAGDEIVKLNGKSFKNIEKALLTVYTEDNTRITVTNGGTERIITIPKKIPQTTDFGVMPYLDANIDKVMDASPAFKAGIKSGDIIAGIDSVKLSGGWYQMSSIIRSNPDKKLLLKVVRGNETIELPVNTEHAEETQQDGTKKIVGRVGIMPHVNIRKLSLVESTKEAFNQTSFIAVNTLDFFGKLVTGRMSAKMMGGPVLIAQMAGESAKSGFSSLFGFTAFISINLGVLNLLPFPVLDGGHITIIAIESVIRRRLTNKVKMAMQQAGSLVLLLLMVYITFNDVARLDIISKLFGGK